MATAGSAGSEVEASGEAGNGGSVAVASGDIRDQTVDPTGKLEMRTRKQNKKKKTTKKKAKRKLYLPRLACMRSEPYEDGGFDTEAEVPGERPRPAHLIVMVNGLIGSARDWRFAAKQFVNKYPGKVVVHFVILICKLVSAFPRKPKMTFCWEESPEEWWEKAIDDHSGFVAFLPFMKSSRSNPSRLTFDGVDVMGQRLAEEVKSVVKFHPTVQRISFIGHSLGGLVARYAVAKLYLSGPASEPTKVTGECGSEEAGNHDLQVKNTGKICGLEPVNFITSATPHLGSRGHNQVPIFCGFNSLEKLAVHTSWFLGRTGRHLFLTDDKDGKPPLLLQMVNDSQDIKFISALKSFKRRVAYANAECDHLVGWSTSSLRHQNNLPKREHLSKKDKTYPHIIKVEEAKAYSSEQEDSSEHKTDWRNTCDLEETMLRRLTRLSWERVDVSFRGSKQRIFAHSTIQVKRQCINSDGEDVIQHMIDNFSV